MDKNDRITFTDKITVVNFGKKRIFKKRPLILGGAQWSIEVPYSRFNEVSLLFDTVSADPVAYLHAAAGQYIRVVADSAGQVIELHHLTKNICYKVIK